MFMVYNHGSMGQDRGVDVSEHRFLFADQAALQDP